MTKKTTIGSELELKETVPALIHREKKKISVNSGKKSAYLPIGGPRKRIIKKQGTDQDIKGTRGTQTQKKPRNWRKLGESQRERQKKKVPHSKTQEKKNCSSKKTNRYYSRHTLSSLGGKENGRRVCPRPKVIKDGTHYRSKETEEKTLRSLGTERGAIQELGQKQKIKRRGRSMLKFRAKGKMGGAQKKEKNDLNRRAKVRPKTKTKKTRREYGRERGSLGPRKKKEGGWRHHNKKRREREQKP